MVLAEDRLRLVLLVLLWSGDGHWDLWLRWFSVRYGIKGSLREVSGEVRAMVGVLESWCDRALFLGGNFSAVGGRFYR